jgi:outer membrane protein TolC
VTVGTDKGQACYVITFADNLGNGIIKPRSPVLAIQYDSERPAGFYTSEEKANDPSKFRPKSDETYNTTFAIQQRLPWGSLVDFSLRLKRQESYYALNSTNGLPQDYGIYYRPYFASFRLGASVPLPFTRNFGPTAAADVNRQLARQSVEVADLDVKAAINSSLLQVEIAFWTLTATIQRLEILNDTLGAMRTQQASIRRLVGEGVLTESDLGQADSRVFQLESRLQQALQDYLTASESMRQLLDSDDQVSYLPVGYSAALDAPSAANIDSARVLDNPGYLRQAVGVRMATLIRDQREAQTRPDISMNASASFAQIGSYGYRSPEQAMRHIVDPDEFILSLSMLYQRPIGNRAAEAAKVAAGHSLERTMLQLRQTELQLREDLDSAQASFASARERAKIAARNIKLAKDLYERSQRLQEAGEDKGKIPAYEALTRLNSLLGARLDQAQARIDARIAESRALASLGTLAEREGKRTAQTESDRRRLESLHQSGVLYQFSGPPTSGGETGGRS